MAFNTNSNIFGGMTLKALLENPDLQHAPAAVTGASGTKGKKIGNGSGEIDFTSAFLGPNLWDKTYSGSNDFNLEYMDLDEFLSENGIPVVDNETLDELVSTTPPPSAPPQLSPRPPALAPGPSTVPQESPRPQPSPPKSPCPSSLGVPSLAATAATNTLAVTPVDQFLVRPKVEATEDGIQKQADGRTTSPGAASSGSTPPVSPLPVHVDFTLTEQDIALSSVPGQSIFDPTSCNFTEEELKPQPMIKKSRKVFVPDDQKDDKYWARRKKNNHAAKRSRDARRIKENQIAMRAAYLEKENGTLRVQMEKVLRENARLKHRLSKFEST